MTNILSIVPYKIFPAKVGGQKAIAVLQEWLAKQTNLITVTVRSNDPSFAKGYSLLNILSDSSFRYINPFYVFTVRRLIRKHKSSYLLLEHPYYGWLGLILKKITGVKLIIRSHNIESLRWKSLGKWWWKMLWRYEALTHRSADFSFFIQDEDRNFAINKYKVALSKCITITYGLNWSSIPSATDLAEAKKNLRERHGLREGEFVLLFNGAFNYGPNLQALKKIVTIIEPLLAKTNLRYKIVICGRDIPAEISDRTYNDIIFAGFVEDVSMYFKGADIFLNPITSGGGIKTKLVEALGYNLNAVSTISGAVGVDPSLTNGKLVLAEDNNWLAFSEAILQACQIRRDTPASYFEYFYSGNAIRRAVEFIEGSENRLSNHSGI